MSYGLWLSAAGMQVNAHRQSVMANNLANTDTVGFKHDLAVFQERRVESQSGGDSGRYAHSILDNLTGGIFVQPTVHTFEQGELQGTGNPLDIAIDGKGFLTVDDGGQTRYTRDGRLTLNREGELVMVAGGGTQRLLDRNGAPIRLDPRFSGETVITVTGSILQGGDEVAVIGLVAFDDMTQLPKIGRNLYQNHGAKTTPSTSRLVSKYVERSTSDPMKGLAAMIEVSRAYELNANFISLQDHTIGQAVSTVGRIG